MAKDSDRVAGALKNDSGRGGLLSGLFAEENAFDRRTLWRIGTWGAAAVGAVIAAVMANQSSLGWRRDQLAAADLARQAQQIQSLTRASENEARQLSSAIDTLNADRDRLYARVTVLEQGLDSVTGTIAKQNSAQTPAAAAPVPPAPRPAAPASMAPLARATPAPADPSPSSFNQAAAALATGPMASPPTASAIAAPSAGPTAMALPAEKPRIEKQKPEPAKSEPAIAAPTQPQPAASPPASAAAVSMPSAPLMAPRSIMAPPDPAAAKLVELPRADAGPRAESVPAATAASPAPAGESARDAGWVSREKQQENDQSKERDASKDKQAGKEKEAKETAMAAADNVTVGHTDFAVDLGSANSIGGLRALWRGLAKSNGELAELRPIMVIRESTTGLGMQLHLAAGPLKDAAAAAKICARLAEAERSCETIVFDGQRLATSADETLSASAAKPIPAKPGYAYRRSPPRHSHNEEAPAKPEPAPPSSTSTFSSLFGGKH